MTINIIQVLLVPISFMFLYSIVPFLLDITISITISITITCGFHYDYNYDYNYSYPHMFFLDVTSKHVDLTGCRWPKHRCGLWRLRRLRRLRGGRRTTRHLGWGRWTPTKDVPAKMAIVRWRFVMLWWECMMNGIQSHILVWPVSLMVVGPRFVELSRKNLVVYPIVSPYLIG